MARVLDRNNIEFIRRGVRLFLLLHGGLQVVKSNTKCSGHILDFNVFFLDSPCHHFTPTLEAGLFALEDGLIAAAIHVLAKKGPVA